MADALFVVLSKLALSLGEGALEKIGKEVAEAASITTDFKHSIKQIEGELLILQAFIAQFSPHKISDKTFDTWLDQVRDVAHDLEDIIDEYAYLTAQSVDTSSFFKRKFNQIRNFSTWQKFPSQICQIEARIQRLTAMKNRYGISVRESDTRNKPQHPHQRFMSESAYLTDNSEVVGNANEIERLTQLLVEDIPERTLIAILGMGGLGKTTIASNVYKNQRIRRTFDCHAWVAVSQSYHIEELLKEIINQLSEQRASIIASGYMTMSRMRLVEVIQSYLRDRKYMIVLDDVWDTDAWLYLNHAFVRNNCRSKVLITTRRKDVSSLAVDSYVIELKTLKHAESWELFCKKAFRALIDDKCPDLGPWPEKIVSKCQGLPLAIVTIGSLLSYREVNEQEWKVFYDQFSWQLSNNPELSWISGVLNMSLHDLPSYLRSCFLYCSLYPEDYTIRRKMISKLWIAEGLVEDRGDGTTMEEVAEYYLVQLTQRSLLQVTERSVCGRARTFRMHDLVREVTLNIAKKEKFGISYGSTNITQVTDAVRRLSIQRGSRYFNSLATSRLRSFLLFDSEVPSSLICDAISRFRLLRVLCLRFANIEQVPGMVAELYSLRYLDFSYTKVKQIPASFRKLTNLQVLDLRSSYVEELPLEITMLTNLRHLYVYVVHEVQFRLLNCVSGTKIHGNIFALRNLQTLQTISANKDLVSHLGNLTLLRSLVIMKVRQCYITELWDSLTKMPNLGRLGLCASDKNEVLNLKALRPLPNIKVFWIAGKLEGGLLPPMLSEFEKLTQLKMDWSCLNKDPIGSFSQMVNLVDVWLFGSYSGEHLTFSAGWFPKLRSLHLDEMEHLNHIEIEDGTMMSLHTLELVGLRNLKIVPKGIKYIRTLQHMILADMSNEFRERMLGSDNHIVQHIPNIHIFDSSDSQAVDNFIFGRYLAKKFGPGAIRCASTK